MNSNKGYHTNNTKYQTIKAAKELLYGAEVIKQLEGAKTDNELTIIMRRARYGKIKEYDESLR